MTREKNPKYESMSLEELKANSGCLAIPIQNRHT